MWKSSQWSTTKVTMELREILDNGINVWGENPPQLIHDDYIKNMTMNEEGVRDIITNHFLFRQIGFETVGRFLHEWRQRTREISPHFLNITKAQALLFSDDPLEGYNLKETYSQRTTNTSSGTSTGSGSSDVTTDTSTSDSESGTRTNTNNVSEDKKHLFSDTPQGSVDNIITHMSNGAIDDNTSTTTDNESTSRESGGTSSTETKTTDSSTATTSTSDDGTNTYTLERRGNIGVQPLGDEIRAYQRGFENIIAMIIKEYESLFLRVY